MKRKLDICYSISSDLCKAVPSGREIAPPGRSSEFIRDGERLWYREYTLYDYQRVFQAAIDAGNKAAAAVTPDTDHLGTRSLRNLAKCPAR